MWSLRVGLFAVMIRSTLGFVPFLHSTTRYETCDGCLYAKKAGKGFGSDRNGGLGFGSQNGNLERAPLDDVLDIESVMQEFFSDNEAWSPLFRSIATSASVPAMSFLGGSHGEEIEFHEASTPWKQLASMPSSDEDRKALAKFLDAMQQSFIDLPVNEAVKEDENDLYFIEEGRRLLAITRFHVLRDNSGGSVKDFDSLFSTCWSELAQLSISNEANTGSLILVPEYNLGDLQRFADVHLQRPLQWLGMDGVFEVSSIQRESPAIRLLHKLSDISTDSYDEPETM